jgi:cyclic-di-GMP phosphodiesterase TipF (flagellum assembly factor)
MSLVADTRLDSDDDRGGAPTGVAILPRQSWLVDLLVFAAIAMTAVAATVALQGEVGLSPLIAIALGIAAFVILASMHMALRRAEYRGRIATSVHDGSYTDTAFAPAIPEAPRSNESKAPASAKSVPEQRSAPAPAQPDVASRAAPAAAAQSSSEKATANPPKPAQPDPWAVRPGDDLVPKSAARSGDAAAAPTLGPARPRTDGQDPEVIETVLARMARDLNGPNRGVASSASAAPQPAPSANQTESPLTRAPDAARTPPAGPAAPPPLPPLTAKSGVPQQQAADGDEHAAPEAGESVQDKLAAIAGALAQERIDVFLAPIAGLEGDGVAHFEVAVRLRMEDEVSQDRRAYGEAAAGTPLLPLIDTLALAKSRRIGWRVFKPEDDGRVFTAVDTGSLTDTQFLADFDAMTRADVAGAKRLVMSFGHADARALTQAQTATLSRLSKAGFAFALEDLVDLDMDFDGLRNAGFSFVKIDADVFLDGMPVGQSRIPADDICRHLKSFDLQPIVGHIADRSQLQRLRACGVALGQGPLLGGAHVVKSEWLGD